MKLKKLFVLIVFSVFSVSFSVSAATNSVIDELKAGNARFVTGKLIHPNQDAKRRGEVVSEQHPKAIILSCSDSRVPPEIIFDQGLGDLFVVRVAGNVLNTENLGSIDYALEHLHVKEIIVLGHSRCGAVTAAFQDGGVFGRVKDVIRPLKHAVKEAKKRKCNDCDIVELASHINVMDQVKKLLFEFRANVTGAYYDLATGKVEFIDNL